MNTLSTGGWICAEHSQRRILIVDRAPQAYAHLALACARNGSKVSFAGEWRDVAGVLQNNRVGLAVIDTQLPHGEALLMTQRIHVSFPRTKLVLTGAERPPELVLRLLRCGDVGFLRKPIEPVRFGLWLAASW